jgi:geranylgeranyl pyrophosphate synthase
MAIAYEKARDESKEMLETAWKRELNGTVSHKDIESLCADLKAIDRSEKLQEAYKEQAIRSIAELDNPSLKGLLRRLIGKIFNDTEIKGWCGEVVEDQLHAPQP